MSLHISSMEMWRPMQVREPRPNWGTSQYHDVTGPFNEVLTGIQCRFMAVTLSLSPWSHLSGLNVSASSPNIALLLCSTQLLIPTIA
jgi:hypothetical protein